MLNVLRHGGQVGSPMPPINWHIGTQVLEVSRIQTCFLSPHCSVCVSVCLALLGLHCAPLQQHRATCGPLSWTSKGPEWNPLLFAHPSTLNSRKVVRTPPQVSAISQTQKLLIWLFRLWSSSRTSKLTSLYPMGFPLFKVDGWANIKKFPFRALIIFSLLR